MTLFGSTMYGWIMWQQPYWLLLLILLFIGLFFRSRAYHIQKTHDYLNAYPGKNRFWTYICFRLPLWCMFVAMMLIVAALGDATRGYTVVEEKSRAHRIFVWVDSSSSMYEF
ncbi:MAG: hypothetical protein G01um101466_253, partial [Parcubacteria group bacterium Gr01-1014_66]